MEIDWNESPKITIDGCVWVRESELATIKRENEKLRTALSNILRSSVPAFGDDGNPITDDDGNLGMIYDNLYFNAAKEALK